MNAQQISLQIDTDSPLDPVVKERLVLPTRLSDLSELTTFSDSLQNLLSKQGYIDISRPTNIKVNDSTYSISFQLGDRYALIRIDYDPENWNRKDLARLIPKVEDDNFILAVEQLEPTLQALTGIQSAKGDPFAKVQLRNIRKTEDNSLRASLSLESTQGRTIDSLVIRGYEKFPPSFVRYYAGIRIGDVFDQARLLEQANNINSLGFARSSRSPEVFFEPDQTTVYLYLEKRNNNLFDGILGFNTNEDDGNLEFNGYLNLELNNNLNYGEQLSINYKADGREQQNFRVALAMPYLLRSPLGVELELKIFKRDSTFSTTDQQARLTYQFDPKLIGSVGYKGYNSSNLRQDESLVQDVADYDAAFFTAGIRYIDNQDNILFPIKTLATIDSEWGKRETDTLNDDQYKIAIYAHHIFNLNLRNSIYLRNETRYIQSEDYLINELYRFGGINSIRGFNENSIDAQFYSVLNTEYRYQFNSGLYAHSIIDLGYFENSPLNLKEKLYSFGLGIGFSTQAGVFKLNIANGNSESQNFKFSNTKIHLSLSSRF
ncbi:BamA/TamA family outer membrane protein [Aureitalea marina]|uniref:BamA/TamA family outer membrane protein n=1 Tax=Aureitalea marina TaxID=930804 RepID=UPI0015E3FC1C|nr:BamA/TamA family outer membrane protein [Aureitalea marina]